MEYLAYGSNLSSIRLRQRAPSARALATVEIRGWQLRFHKRGMDGSGKCNIVPARSESIVHAVVFSLDPGEKALLDTAEGLGRGYRCEELELEVADRRLTPFVYLAQESHIDDSLVPFDWYLHFVVAGAREHSLPGWYLEDLIAQPALRDPDRSRGAVNTQLLRGTASLDHRLQPKVASAVEAIPSARR